ncbi:MAG: RNA methyltransferase [Alphaproteobacteria bacterium]|nr:RNA methyltransferase [Alphaproteobacteria bacterium]MDE2630864.1 RNA methyltransferase [Alphaproteobacteria bacterium]
MSPAIILCRPQLGENIGAAARAMKNFGLAELRLVAPRDGWPNEKAEAMAAGACDIVASASVFETLHDALADLNLVYAATARERGFTKPILTPTEAAARLLAAGGAATGLLFGNERAGLDNEDISLADAIITIPTAEFSSLNLGQAVLIVCFEWFRAGDKTPAERLDHGPLSKPASREEMFQLFDHLEGELMKSGFLYPPDKKPPMIRNIRAMLHRASLTDQEVRTLRGMIVALTKGKHREKKE